MALHELLHQQNFLDRAGTLSWKSKATDTHKLMYVLWVGLQQMFYLIGQLHVVTEECSSCIPEYDVMLKNMSVALRNHILLKN